MRLRNVVRWAAAGAVVALVVAGAAVAAGQRSAAGVTTIKAVQGPPKFQINRFVEDTLRWDKDRYTVKSGQVTFEDGRHTGALPGTLVRGGREAVILPETLAAE